MPLMANFQKIEINPARRLIGSPEWSELGVVFDARSGDFWIVSNEVRKALLSVSADSTEDFRELPQDVRENLVAHGIIQSSRTS